MNQDELRKEFNKAFNIPIVDGDFMSGGDVINDELFDWFYSHYNQAKADAVEEIAKMIKSETRPKNNSEAVNHWHRIGWNACIAYLADQFDQTIHDLKTNIEGKE